MDTDSAQDLRLPTLENGVLAIGDLWDANSSSRPGFNIFGKRFCNDGKGKLTFAPIHGGDVKLTHCKDTESALKDLDLDAAVTIEMLGGFVKVTGGLEFQKLASHSYENEHITWTHKVQTHSAQPTVQNYKQLKEKYVDPFVCDKIEQRKIAATHYVSAVHLGAAATASISVRQSNKNTKYRVKAFLKGAIDLIVVSVNLEASAQLSEEVTESNYDLQIKLSSVPAIPKPPVKLGDFNGLGDLMMAEMGKVVFFTQAPGHYGLPNLFVLTPLSLLLDRDTIPRPLDSSKERAARLATLVAAFHSLRDYASPDYCKRLLLDYRPELYKIISDSDHEITTVVSAFEQQIANTAKQYLQDLYSAYAEWVYDNNAWGHKIQPLLDKHAHEPTFDKQDIQERIQEWGLKGDEQRLLVTIDDEDETSPVNLFSTLDQLEAWLLTERTVKFVLYVGSSRTRPRRDSVDGSEGVPAGSSGPAVTNFPRALQKLGKRLGDLGAQIAVAYPSACSRPGIGLRCKSRLSDITYEGEEDVAFVLHVLEAMVGSSSHLHARFYNVYAEELGFAMPLQPNGVVGIESTGELIAFLRPFVANIKVYDDMASFQSAALNNASIEMRFVATVQALHSTTAALHALQAVQVLLRGREVEYELAIVGMEIDDSNEAPLLLIFSGRQLTGICIDLFDLLVLGHPSASALSLLHPRDMCNNSLATTARVNAGCLVAKRLGVDVPQCTKSPLEPVARPSSCSMADAVRYALQVAKCLFEDDKRQITSMATALVRIIVDMLEAGGTNYEDMALELSDLLHAAGNDWWDCTRREVMPNKWKDMQAGLDNLMAKCNPYLYQLHRAATMLKGIAAEIPGSSPGETDAQAGNAPQPSPAEGQESKDESADTTAPEESNTPPDANAKEGDSNDLQKLLLAISTHVNCTANLKQKIEQVTNPKSGNHPRVASRLVLPFIQIEIDGVVGGTTSRRPLFHLLQLIQYVQDAMCATSSTIGQDDQDVDESSTVARAKQESIALEFILSVINIAKQETADTYAEAISELTLALRNRAWFAVITSLVACSLSPAHYILTTALAKLSSLDDWQGIIRMLDSIWKHFHRDGQGREKELTLFWSYVWKNPKFQLLMQQHVHNTLVQQAIIVYQFKSLSPTYMPPFIPTAFVGPLKAVLASASDEGDGSTRRNDLCLQWDWPTLGDAVNALQTIWVRAAIPKQFPERLLRNMLKHQSLKAELLALPVEVHWNVTLECFDQPWDLHIILEVIQATICNSAAATSTDTKQISSLRVEQPLAESVDDRPTLWACQLTSLHSTNDTHLIRWFKNLQFGGACVWEDETGITRPQMLHEFVTEVKSSPTTLRWLAHALGKRGCAIPLAVAVPSPLVLAQAYLGLPLPVMAVTNGRVPHGNLKLFQDSDSTGVVTVLSVGQGNSGRDTGWILNNYFFSHEAFTSGAKLGYTELAWVDAGTDPDHVNSEGTSLLLNVSGCGDELHQTHPELVKWLANCSTRVIVFWMCEGWTWTEFQTKRRRLRPAFEAGTGARVLDVCVNPPDDIRRSLERDLPHIQIIAFVGECHEEVLRQRVREMVNKAFIEASNNIETSQNLASPPPTLTSESQLQFLNLAHVIDKRALEIVRVIKTETVESLKLAFLPQKGQPALSAQDLQTHWEKRPIFRTLLQLFSAFLAGTHQARVKEGVAYIEQELAALSSSSTQAHLLQKQRSVLLSHLNSQPPPFGDRRLKLEGDLLMTNYRLEHQHSITITQILEQILLVRRTCPELLQGGTAIGLALANCLLCSVPVRLPSTSAQWIAHQHEPWFTQFMASVQTSRLCPRSVYVVSLVGDDYCDAEREQVLSALLGQNYIGDTVHRTPLSTFTIRVIPFTPTMQGDVMDSTGTSIEAILFVEAPITLGTREGDRRLLSLLLATSHITIMLRPQFKIGALEIAMMGRLALPQGISKNLPPPNLMCLTSHGGGSSAQDVHSQLTVALRNVRALSRSFLLDTGVQTDFDSVFSLLETNVAMNAVTPQCTAEGIHAAVVQHMLDTEHAGYSFPDWVKCITETWETTKKLPMNCGNAETVRAEIELRSRLGDLKQSIGEAVVRHGEGYAEYISSEMDDLDLQVTTTPTALTLTKMRIRGWAESRLKDVYDRCGLNEGSPCDACKRAALSETALRAQCQDVEFVKKQVEHCINEAKSTLLHRIHQVLTYKELTTSATGQVLADYKGKDEEGALSWVQFMSTRNLLTSTRSRFMAEIRDLYGSECMRPTDVMENPETLFQQIKHGSAYQDQMECKLDWKHFYLLRTELEQLPTQILPPSSGDLSAELRHYNTGHIYQLKQKVNELIKNVLQVSDSSSWLFTGGKCLRLPFILEIHVVALKLLWLHVEKVEGQDWTVKYNAVKQPQPVAIATN